MNNQQKLIQLRDRIPENLFTRFEKELPEKGSEFYEICIELAPHSFLAFVSSHLKEQFSIQPFHRLIAEIFEEAGKVIPEFRRVIISAPPRAGKSLLTQYYVAWLCGRNERTANIFVSYGQRLSTKFMSKVALIMQSAEYKLCFPEFCGFQKGSNTLFNSGGSIFGTSVGGAITGMDAGSLDLIGEVFPGISIIDDPLKSGDSQAEIEALEPYYIDEFSTRRTGNWRQALIATRFSIDDLHAIVMNLDGLYDSDINPTGWLYLNLQALCKNPSEDLLLRKLNESLWETHPTLNSTELLKLERKNEYRFNTVYQGNPSVSTGNIVNSAVIHNPSEELLFGNLILAVDCANSSSDTSDYSAVTVAGFGTDKSIVIVDQIVGKFSVQELRVEIEKLFNTYVINEICFENSALGLVLIPEYETNFANCNPTNIKVTKLSVQLYGNKVRRLQYIAHEFANTFFTNTWLESYTQLRAELLAFPYGKNDDRVDSLIWALIRLSQLRPLTDEADLFGYGLGDNFTDVYTYNPEIELYT